MAETRKRRAARLKLVPPPTNPAKTREQIHDEEIFPLMAQIILIAKRHDIPMVASFDLTEVPAGVRRAPDAESLLSTTGILPAHADQRLVGAVQLLREGYLAFAVTRRGGS
jgi:hypothetical protein